MFKPSTPRTNLRAHNVASRLDGGGWILAGCGVALAGVVLCLEGLLPEPLAGAIATARRLGLEAGVLVVGGLGLCAIGSAQRSLGRRAAQPSEDSLLLEQVANDLLIVRDGVDQAREATRAVQEETRSLQSSVGSVHDSLQALAQHVQAAQQSVQSGTHDDAIFRLAASLDQLGARMEQRMKVQYSEMQSSLDELNSVVVSVRRNFDELFHGVRGEVVPQASSEPDGGSYGAPAAPAVEGHTASLPLGLLDQLDDPLTDAPSTHAPLAQTGVHKAPLAQTNVHKAPLAQTNVHKAPLAQTSVHKAPLAQTGVHQAPLAQTGVHQAPLAQTGMYKPPLAQTGLHPAPLPSRGAPAAPLAQSGFHPAPLAQTGLHPAAPLPRVEPSGAPQVDTEAELAELRSLITDERLRASLEQLRRPS